LVQINFYHDFCLENFIALNQIFNCFIQFLMIRYITVIISVMLAGIFFSCKNVKLSGSKSTAINDTANYPYWIGMIDSPNVNYYQAVRAFELFWQNRERPVEEDGEGKDIFNKDAKEKNQNAVNYAYEYKRFLNWQQRNKNLVMPDGKILSPDQIIEQWNKQQQDSI
jgi:hypothetical protein